MQGDLIACIAGFAGRATSIEANPKYCQSLRARGVDVVCEELNRQNAQQLLPVADVYYVWITPSINMQMAELIQKTLRARGHTARVFYPFDQEGMDGGIDPLASHLATLQSPRFGCSGRVDRVFFDETALVAARAHECPATGTVDYAHPFGGRHGHFGIFHLLSFDAGRVCTHCSTHGHNISCATSHESPRRPEAPRRPDVMTRRPETVQRVGPQRDVVRRPPQLAAQAEHSSSLASFAGSFFRSARNEAHEAAPADAPHRGALGPLCAAVPGMGIVDPFDIRAPMAVADHIARISTNLSYVEIGSRNGDLFECIAHYARRATVFEGSAEYCPLLHARVQASASARVHCPSFFPDTIEAVEAADPNVLDADIYYTWVNPPTALKFLHVLRAGVRAGRIRASARFVTICFPLSFYDQTNDNRVHLWRGARLASVASRVVVHPFVERASMANVHSDAHPHGVPMHVRAQVAVLEFALGDAQWDGLAELKAEAPHPYELRMLSKAQRSQMDMIAQLPSPNWLGTAADRLMGQSQGR